MTQKSMYDIRRLLEFAPVDAQYAEMRDFYLSAFGTSEDMENFVEGCGSVEAALEVLKICEAKR